MFRNILFVYYLFLWTIACSYSQIEKKKFRKDYKYIEATESFYKFNTIQRNWQDAKDMCELEGASFFYPEDQNEADALSQFWNSTQSVISRIYIGVSSWIVKGVYETVDGQSIDDVYNNWAPGEPNDANGEEDCVLMRRDGTLNDVNCKNKNPYVCKKTLSSLEWNTKCDMPNLDYVFDITMSKCYKFHLEPRTWSEAYAVCHAEQSYLAIVQSQIEADQLTKLTSAALNNGGQSSEQEAVFLGFLKRRGTWTTTKGTKLSNSGYCSWGDQQPDGGDNETCGAMFYNGLLQDVNCDVKSYFICEHDVATLSNSFNDRFGEN